MNDEKFENLLSGFEKLFYISAIRVTTFNFYKCQQYNYKKNQKKHKNKTVTVFILLVRIY